MKTQIILDPIAPDDCRLIQPPSCELLIGAPRTLSSENNKPRTGVDGSDPKRDYLWKLICQVPIHTHIFRREM